LIKAHALDSLIRLMESYKSLNISADSINISQQNLSKGMSYVTMYYTDTLIFKYIHNVKYQTTQKK
jgi:hypothetical protein